MICLYFYYSSNNNNQKIIDNFIEYFTNKFNYEKVPPELDFDVQYYSSLFLSYIEYLKTPDKKILSFWNTKLKPFLKINYPVTKNGIFVTNADFNFIMKEIDKYNQEPNEKSLIDEMRKKINEISKNKENNTSSNKPPITSIKNENLNTKNILRPHSETIASTSTCDSYAYENTSNFLKEKAEIKKPIIYNNIPDNNTIIEIIDEQKNVNTDTNDNNINSNNEDNINSNNEDNKNISIEDNKNTSNEDNNLNIDKESNNNDQNINKENNNNNLNIKNENNNNIIIEKDDIIKNKNKIMNNNINIDDIIGQKSKSEILYKEMNQTFIDREESATKNIIYQPLQKTKIKLIDVNLLLKKIVENDFNKKNHEILYAFIRQSFSFLKKDIFIKKIINCYKHYSKINTPLNKIENLIYFLNVYIIEMYLYYKSIPKDDKLINLLISFYNELISEVIKSINFENINKDSNIIDKKEILNQKLCVKTTKIEKDNKNEVVKYYSNGFIRKKLHNMVDKNHAKLVQLKKEEKKLKKIRNSEIIRKDSIHNIKLEILEEEDEEGKNTHYNENSLNFAQTIIPKKKERSPQNEIIIDKNINDKSRNNSFRHSSKKLEEYNFESLITDKELIGIIGEEHKDIIKNNQLVSTVERLLLNLKNILLLLNTKNYNESEIIKMKNNEQFYESFSFYEGKEKDISHKKKEKNKDNNNKKNALFLNKSMTLIPRHLKFDYSKLNIAQKKPKRCFTVTDWETSQIGDQLINISKKALNKIECKELYGAIFTKNAKEINCPNVMDNIKKFNSLIGFVIEDILSYDFPNDRARMIEKWALIAQYCKKKKDQSDCCAINSALNHYIITGLNLTLKCLKNKTKLIMNELNEYCTLEGNYKILREEIKNIKKNEFFIPYLGTLLRDLTFFEESGKYLIQGNMINFEKIEKVQNSLDLFFKFKNSDNKVNDEQNEELKFFEFLEDKPEEELENTANQLEPIFKIRNIQQRDKRITEIDKKYFINESKRFSCIPNSKTMVFPNI